MDERFGLLKRFITLLSKPIGKQNLVIFLLCLFCSASFWLFIKLSRDERATFIQPLVITNLPSENVLGDLSHTLVRFTVQAPGIRLLLSQFFHSGDTLKFDAAQMHYTERDGELWYYLSSTDIRRNLARLPLVEGTIVNVSPDTLFARFLFAAQKKVPVQFAGSLAFATSFGQKDTLQLYPDSVTVSGPENIVDTLTVIHTQAVHLHNISQSVSQKIALENPGFTSGISLNVNQVTLEVPVGELREATVVVPIAVIRSNSTVLPAANVLLFPAQATVKVLAPIDLIQDISADDFEAFVHCPLELPQHERRLEVFVKPRAAFVTIGSVTPPFVEFVISD